MNEKNYAFTAVIEPVPDKGGAFVRFPYDLRQEFGRGRVKVRATFDGEIYEGSLVNMGVKNEDGSVCHIIGIRKEIQRKIGKGPGDTVAVTIRERQGERALFAQPLVRAGTVYLFGAGHVSRALAQILAMAEFRTVVYDQRPEAAWRTFFPDAAERICGPFEEALDRLEPITEEDYAVIMTPGHQGDYEVLSQVLRTPAKYIGCIGSRKKVSAARERLLADGFTAAEIDRVWAPIGLPIGGETPAEVAVSVAAQLIACRSGRLEAFR